MAKESTARSPAARTTARRVICYAQTTASSGDAGGSPDTAEGPVCCTPEALRRPPSPHRVRVPTTGRVRDWIGLVHCTPTRATDRGAGTTAAYRTAAGEGQVRFEYREAPEGRFRRGFSFENIARRSAVQLRQNGSQTLCSRERVPSRERVVGTVEFRGYVFPPPCPYVRLTLPTTEAVVQQVPVVSFPAALPFSGTNLFIRFAKTRARRRLDRNVFCSPVSSRLLQPPEWRYHTMFCTLQRVRCSGDRWTAWAVRGQRERGRAGEIGPLQGSRTSVRGEDANLRPPWCG